MHILWKAFVDARGERCSRAEKLVFISVRLSVKYLFGAYFLYLLSWKVQTWYKYVPWNEELLYTIFRPLTLTFDLILSMILSEAYRQFYFSCEVRISCTDAFLKGLELFCSISRHMTLTLTFGTGLLIKFDQSVFFNCKKRLFRPI